MLHIVKTLDDIYDLREWVAKQPVMALDTETTGFDIYAHDFQVRTVQLGNSEEAWVIPFDGWAGPVAELLHRFDGRLLIHNSRYDIEALGRHGVKVDWHKVDDTMIAMRLAEPHYPAGLKEAAGRHVSAAAARSQKDLHKAMRANKWTWATVPLDFPPYLFYAAMDVILTCRLDATAVCTAGRKSKVYGLEMDLREICTEMERRGMRIDTEFCQATLLDLVDEADMIKSTVAGACGINIMSNVDLGRWLLGAGVKLTSTTATGAPSVSRESLEEARPSASGTAAAVIDDALRVRKILKLAHSYFENFVNMNTDGLLHPSIETVAAKTGRMSIRNPALQTLPRGDDPDSKLVRQAVIPREETHVLVASDYSQIELRLIAAFSGDEDLQAAFKTADAAGSDFFTEATRAVYSDPAIPKTDSRRTGVKTLFYASGYGAGIAKMAATAGMPVDEMRLVSEKVFARYPGVKRLMKACERTAQENDNWITTPAGRRIWIDPARSYAAMNGLIQGHAADVFKRATVEMAHAGLAEFMVVPVHDEMLLSVPKDDVSEVAYLVGKIMTDATAAVPLLAEPGDPALTWADAK